MASLLTRWMPGFPLLGKELNELAARPRTYVLRVLTCAALALAFAVPFLAALAASHDFTGMIGRGAAIFEAVYWSVAACIVLIVPASAALSVALERERGSLVGLLLTPIGPWSLLLQKWLSRQVVVVTLIASALPLFAIAYGLGGVEPNRLAAATITLLIAGAEAAALGLAVGSWSRTGTSAVLLTLLALVAVAAAGPVRETVSGRSGIYLLWAYGRGELALSSLVAQLGAIEPLSIYRVTAGLDEMTRWRGAMVVKPTFSSVAMIITLAAPAILFTGLLGMIARRGIVRQVEPRGPGLLLALFMRLDGWFAAAERRIGRRVGTDLPAAHPVAWREINRRAFANPRYLVRLLVGLGTIALLLALLVGARSDGDRWLGALALAILALVCLVALVLGVGAFEKERSAQTLPVLLTTPLSSRDILVQKIAPLRRLLGMLWLVILLVGFVQWFLRPADDDRMWAMVLVATLGALAPMACAWIGAFAGLAIRSRARAAIAACAMCAVWLVGPLLIAIAYAALFAPPDRARRWSDDGNDRVALPLAVIESASPIGAYLATTRDGVAWNVVHGGGWYRWPPQRTPLFVAEALVACLLVGWLARLATTLAGDPLLRRSAADG